MERLLAAEREVASLQADLVKLQETISQNGHTEDQAALLAENQKLKYRLNILKRAADSPRNESTNSAAMYSILGLLNNLFGKALKSAYPDVPDAPVLVALTNPVMAAAKGIDYQCNSALPILQILKSRGIKAKPSDVADKIVNSIEKNPLIETLEVAPAGFINVKLSKDETRRLLELVLHNGVQAPQLPGKKRRVVVDFSSPNIAKEMHVGHLRSTIIGDSLCRLLEYLGHDVVRINHVGDWGTQFGMLIAHLQDQFPDYLEVSPSVQDLQAFYRASKKRFDEDAKFKERAYSCVVKLQSGEPDYIRAWELICDASRKEFQKVYDRLGIRLIERGESFYQKRMEVLVKELEDRGLLIEDEGRKILWAEGISVPFTIVKSDGGFTYDTSDMATIRQRLEEERADWLIYVTDAGQSQHFEILRRCAVQVGFMDADKVRMDHVTFGVVLGEDKKKFKTRSGDTVRLVDLLDEGLKRALDKLKEKERDKFLTPEELAIAQRSVAYGCVKYADLSHNRNHEYVFSFDKMLDDKGNTAVYLLYALSRIRSIARTAGVTQQQLQEASKTTSICLDHEKERKLAKTLIRFPDVLNTVCSSLYLHHLCEFVYEVACTFSEFYDVCYCVEKNERGEIVKIDMSRLLLTEATARILETSFHILGLEPVSKM